MAIAGLPDRGHISDNARTEGEVKNDLEAMRDHIAGSSPHGTATLTISAGAVTPLPNIFPSYGIDPEVPALPDDLTNINTTNTGNGFRIVLWRAGGVLQNITLKHTGTGAAGTLWNMDKLDVILDNPEMYIEYMQFGGAWYEINRQYGSAINLFRDYLGLGDAAVATEGAGNGLDADLVDGLHAAAFLLVAATAADSTLLAGIASSNYARKDVGAQQTFSGALSGLVKVQADAGAGVDTIMQLRENGVLRMETRWDATADEAVIRGIDVDGSTTYSELKMPSDSSDDDLMQYLHPSDATRYGVITQKELDAEARLVSDVKIVTTTEFVLTDSGGVFDAPTAWKAVTFPKGGANGVRLYRVWFQAVLDHTSSGGTNVDFQLGYGPLGTEADPQFKTGTININANEDISYNLAVKAVDADKFATPAAEIICPDAGDTLTVSFLHDGQTGFKIAANGATYGTSTAKCRVLIDYIGG